MAPSFKMLGFTTVLAAAFGVAALAGATVGPDRDGAERGEADPGGHGAEARGHGAEARGHGADAGGSAPDPVRGLAVADGELRLELAATELERGTRTELRFAILDEAGATVRDFDVEHEKRMHVIVVRRDGSGFQHLHPELGEDGNWRVSVALPDAGSYRVFADFSRQGEPRTLAADLTVDGDADYRPLPEPATLADAGDGYEVERGEGLEFTVTRDGEAITPEPYLGARGHLVALREGDLAYLHVHPDEDALAFMADFPTEGRYGLYLQFKHRGEVRTAEFTQDVAR